MPPNHNSCCTDSEECHQTWHQENIVSRVRQGRRISTQYPKFGHGTHCHPGHIQRADMKASVSITFRSGEQKHAHSTGWMPPHVHTIL